MTGNSARFRFALPSPPREPLPAPSAALTLPLALALTAALVPTPAPAQGTPEDYARSEGVAELLSGKVEDAVDQVAWIGDSHRFWYRRTVAEGHDFVLVDADAREKGVPFDHERLAAALATPLDEEITAITLPFSRFEFVDDGAAIEFRVEGETWRCDLGAYTCGSVEDEGARGSNGREGRGGFGFDPPETIFSPDSTYEAAIRNHNVAVRRVDIENDDDAEVDDGWRILSQDGSAGDAYDLRTAAWSPDSRKIAVHRTRPGHERIVRYVESSPQDQLQPKYMERTYPKPGDVLDVDRPVVFHVESGRQLVVDDELFPNAYRLSNPEWRDDGRRLTFEYNQRGHQVYRVIEVDAETGEARALISEEPETFFAYRDLNGSFRDHGTRFRHDVEGGEEIVWASERDGWRHLYLYDALTGEVKHQITRGEWVVTQVDSVDDAARQIWFRANGVDPEQDPYFVHYYRIDFDGSGLVAFTEEDGTHDVTWSADRTYYVDRWSRVDLPPVAVLKRTADQSIVMELERADASALLATGWRYPEVFVAKARDGETDVWGVIVRPMELDAGARYPVVESIYAGPQGSFVPKSFTTLTGFQSLAELGFVVVQIDGMGTNNRSKAFHDVAWQNLGDAGFPDRIRWHRAVAEVYPWYDTSRVGVYGTSAGGQNALGGLLFHPDFYDAGVAAAGSHDNRMDKIWWNEQWMGWPLGSHYSAASNVDNAWRLRGDLLLIVGELDTNVDPSTTLQVADRLIEADKHFELLYLPGAGHTSGGAYGADRRNDFFVRHLLGVNPPHRNRATVADDRAGGRESGSRR